MNLNILYEDNHLLIAVKPQNIPAQADDSHDPDLLTMLKAYIKEAYQKPGAVYLGLVHRLDRPCGGVMAFARTSKAAARLGAQLQSRRMSRSYFAVVHGTLPKEGVLQDWLCKDTRTNISRVVEPGTPGAKFARLHFWCIAQDKDTTLVRVQLDTGRSHQIRVQFSHAGHALLHDQKYDPAATRGNLALWAYRLQLEHPTRREAMVFTCPPPDEAPWNRFDWSNQLT